jgi:hypothetical protein
MELLNGRQDPDFHGLSPKLVFPLYTSEKGSRDTEGEAPRDELTSNHCGTEVQELTMSKETLC